MEVIVLTEDDKTEYFRNKLLELLQEYEEYYIESKCKLCKEGCNETIKQLDIGSDFLSFVFRTLCNYITDKTNLYWVAVEGTLLRRLMFSINYSDVTKTLRLMQQDFEDEMESQYIR